MEAYLLVALPSKARPVADSGGHGTTVDVIEFVGVCPVSFDIVNFEADVRRYPGRERQCDQSKIFLNLRWYRYEIQPRARMMKSTADKTFCSKRKRMKTRKMRIVEQEDDN